MKIGLVATTGASRSQNTNELEMTVLGSLPVSVSGYSADEVYSNCLLCAAVLLLLHLL